MMSVADALHPRQRYHSETAMATMLRSRPKCAIAPIRCMSLRNHTACIGNYCDAVLSGEIVTSAAYWHRSALHYIVACVLLRIILTEREREIAAEFFDPTGFRGQNRA
jgi:hypothetical protein